VYKYLIGGNEEGARFCSVVPSDKTRSNGHKLKYRKFQVNTNYFFFFPTGQALEQVNQRCCGVSILGDTWKLTHPENDAISVISELDRVLPEVPSSLRNCGMVG